jgi:hypothetical protein
MAPQNNKKVLSAAKGYAEVLTDADKQYYRDLVTNLTKEDKTVSELTEAQAKQYAQQFSGLARNVLDKTLEKVRNQQRQLNQFEIVSSMPGLKEVFSLGESLSNSLLGDLGVGGFLSNSAKDSKDVKQDLSKQLSGLGGIDTSNITSYNWQKWFDETLTQEAEKAATRGVTDKKQIEQKKKFAKDYVETYLRPRFDFSKSMGEFTTYLETDLSQPEFVAEAIDKKKIQTAFEELKAKREQENLDKLQNTKALKFDPSFYFSPTGDEVKTDAYKQQQAKVSLDWENAKQGIASDGIDWAAAAYEYGVNLKDKNQFAQLHYELYGKQNNFDGAKDIVSADKVKDFINKTLMPELKKSKVDLTQGPFKNYISPEETADGILSELTGGKSWDQYVSDVLGIKPPKELPSNATEEQKKTYQDELATYNSRVASLKDQVGENPLNQIRDEVVDFYYNQGEESIRAKIKKLKDKGIAPTQKELGIDYIERAIDKPATGPEAETALYKMFKESGYEKDEKTFYTEMFPDVSIEEQKTVTNLLSGPEGFKKFFNVSDPFSFDPDKMFSAFDSLGSQDKEESEDTKDTYFTLDKEVGTGQVGVGSSKKKPKATNDLYSDFEFGSFGFF